MIRACYFCLSNSKAAAWQQTHHTRGNHGKLWLLSNGCGTVGVFNGLYFSIKWLRIIVEFISDFAYITMLTCLCQAALISLFH